MIANETQPLSVGSAGPLAPVLSFLRSAAIIAAGAAILSGCGQSPASQVAAEEIQEVGVVQLTPAPLPIRRELPGRITPTRIAEVRARVAGIVMKRNFEQGSDVKAGEVLYEIDPQPFQIEVDAATAALRKAEAVHLHETQNFKRMESLAPSRAIAQSQMDVATANLKQAEADVAARKADLARAKLNLEYTKIRAPISGRIGPALVTEGALVGQSDYTHVATIQQLNLIYADFTQSVAELAQLRREFASGALERTTGGVAVRLVLDNGETYPSEGRLLFSDSRVDPTTGQVTLRGEFPNPQITLLPGMFVRVQLTQGIDPDGLAVPQQAVRRTDSGGSQLFLVRDDNHVILTPVRLGRAVDDRWQVLDGVKPGDRVVVEGFDKFVAGDVVEPRPWTAPSGEDDVIERHEEEAVERSTKTPTTLVAR